MMQKVLCPVLVGRDDALSELEDALLAASRGDGSLVAIGGEAGVGKTRTTSELAARARKLGMHVLQGSCSEATLSLPYLPFVESIGNYLSGCDLQAITPKLAGSRAELAQLFPQLADDHDAAGFAGDPSQARLRLFEAIVSLLAIPAAESGLMLLIEDIHWADASTRELLDHLARRLSSTRALVVVTYRTDEMERTHPLMPSLQSWRRSGVARTVRLHPLDAHQVADMIAAIFDESAVSDSFRDLMFARSEGVPFVLEEMLKDALDRGDVFRGDAGWDRRAIEDLAVPETVKDTILLRVSRLDPAFPPILQVAAVMGQSFSYDMLESICDANAETVAAAVTSAIAQQLIHDDTSEPGRYRWRHALTQEVMRNDLILPRRQQIHRRIAERLQGTGRTNELATHLFGASLFAEAVPVCLQAAEEAERAFAWGEATMQYERALPYVADDQRGIVICKLGTVYARHDDVSRAIATLREGIEHLEREGKNVEAAGYRVVLSRSYWEAGESAKARNELEICLPTLDAAGPSEQLALGYMRLSGLCTFDFDIEGCIAAGERAVAVATAAGSDLHRIWAQTFLALGLAESADFEGAFALNDKAADEAFSRGFYFIVCNTSYNEIWVRVFTGAGGLERPVSRLLSIPLTPDLRAFDFLGRSYAHRVRGEFDEAAATCDEAGAGAEEVGFTKLVWRMAVQRTDVLLDLGRIDDAARSLPPVGTRVDLQDKIYDFSAQARVRLATGDIDGAAVLAAEFLADGSRLGRFRPACALAAIVLTTAGRYDDAAALLHVSRSAPQEAGRAFLDDAEAALEIARGRFDEAIVFARRAIAATPLDFRLQHLEARVRLAQALLGRARAGSHDSSEVDREGESELRAAAAEAAALNAQWVLRSAAAVAADAGLDLGIEEPEAPDTPVEMGERMVTVLFADVRDYTKKSSVQPPAEMIERLGSLHRWAKAEISRGNGVIDKFAGDAVMATFNVSGATIDHCMHAVEAALGLRDKAALLDMPIGVGIAVGPAMVGHSVAGANLTVTGTTTNLSARLQAAAGPGEIILSDEAYRRVQGWLEARSIPAVRAELTLKGFDGEQTAYRIAGPEGRE